MTNPDVDPITLYGAPFSLYTGRARSYLIKAGLPYREEPHASAHFFESVLPKAGGRRGVPTIELPDGTVIRDGVAIVDHFEAINGDEFSPETPKQRVVSRLLDTIGAEGLLRPCMHYRWNFDEENEEFLLFHFQTIFAEDDAEQAARDRMQFIKANVNPAWGVSPENHDLIESLHLETLNKLNAHFAKHPYFLGGKPCIGDFGMMAPLYGHLGRDPKPLSLMQFHAVRLLRWVERMNRPEPDVGEFAEKTPEYLADDEVPETLIAALKHFAIDFVPESRAACDCINQWLADNPDVPPNTEVERHLGLCKFEVMGRTISAAAQPFRFYVLKRVQDEFESLGDEDRLAIAELLEQCDMAEVLDMKLTREIGRHQNLEVWR